MNNYRAIKPLTWQKIYKREKMNYIMFQKNVPTFEILLRLLVYLVNKKREISILLLNI